MRRILPVVAACNAMLLVTLVGSQANAFGFSFSNGDPGTFVSVSVDEGGPEYQQVAAEFGPGPVELDLGYASASLSASPLLLSADVDLDGSQTGALVYIGLFGPIQAVSVWTEVTYHADVVFEGGVGTFLLEMSGDFSDSASPGLGTTSLPNGGIAGWSLSGLGLGMDPPTLLEIDPDDGTRLYELEYGVTYRYQTSLRASVNEPIGEDAWRSRDLAISFTPVPEPGVGVLLASGLVVLARRAPRGRS